MVYNLPDGPCNYELTEDFKKAQFPKGDFVKPKMSIYGNTPGEIILRFREYYRVGKALGAYK